VVEPIVNGTRLVMLVRYWRQPRGNFGSSPVAADFRADSIDRERFSAGRAGPAEGKSANCQGRRTHLIKINA
jgi:hypothetical protein